MARTFGCRRDRNDNRLFRCACRVAQLRPFAIATADSNASNRRRANLSSALSRHIRPVQLQFRHGSPLTVTPMPSQFVQSSQITARSHLALANRDMWDEAPPSPPLRVAAQLCGLCRGRFRCPFPGYRALTRSLRMDESTLATTGSAGFEPARPGRPARPQRHHARRPNPERLPCGEDGVEPPSLPHGRCWVPCSVAALVPAGR
jgi:hypothetical protein